MEQKNKVGNFKAEAIKAKLIAALHAAKNSILNILGLKAPEGLSLNPYRKFKTRILAATLFLSTFSLAFIWGSLAFIKHDTNAEENYGTGDGTEGTIAFNIDNPHLVLAIDNAKLGQLVTALCYLI